MVLNKLYNAFLSEKELTTKLLKEFGLSSKKIKWLVDNQKITRVKRGLYSFLDEEGLFSYGLKLLEERNYDLAIACIRKCYSLNPNNRLACLKLFIDRIFHKDYDSVFSLLSTISEKKFCYNNEIHLFLYLLNIVTDIPEQYKNEVKYTSFYNIRIFGNVCHRKEKNRIRTSILNREYNLAIDNTNKLLKEECDVISEIIKVLLVEVIKNERKLKNDLLTFIETQKYTDILNVLMQRKEKGIANNAEYYILELTTKILDLKNNAKIPVLNIELENNIFDAIDNNNFKSAGRFNENHKYNDWNEM